MCYAGNSVAFSVTVSWGSFGRDEAGVVIPTSGAKTFTGTITSQHYNNFGYSATMFFNTQYLHVGVVDSGDKRLSPTKSAHSSIQSGRNSSNVCS